MSVPWRAPDREEQELSDSARSLADWIALTAKRLRVAGVFFGHGTQNAHDEAAWLVAAAARIAPLELNLSLQRIASKKDIRRILALTEKRVTTRRPLAYLLGEAWLSGYRFFVDHRVIVPRSFIAELLDERLSPWCLSPGKIRRVLDLCTGSGCLAILAALAFPRARIDAVDISSSALAVARKNVRTYGLENRISLIKSDLLQTVPMHEYDLIISNPPYVKAQSMRRLPTEFRNEPEIALAGGRDGLDLVRHIIRDANMHLRPKGHLLLEIGHNRSTFERKYPRLPVTWLSTSSGTDAVLWVSAEQLAETGRSTVRQ